MTDSHAEYVALCNNAIHEAIKLAERYREAGNDGMVRMAGTAQHVLEVERDQAVNNEVPASERFGFGPGRFAGDTDWGPEGDAMLDAIREMQLYWQEYF